MVADPGFHWVQWRGMSWCGGRELVTLLVPDKAQHLDGKVAQLPHRARCRHKGPAERGLGSRVICQVCGP